MLEPTLLNLLTVIESYGLSERVILSDQPSNKERVVLAGTRPPWPKLPTDQLPAALEFTTDRLTIFSRYMKMSLAYSDISAIVADIDSRQTRSTYIRLPEQSIIDQLRIAVNHCIVVDICVERDAEGRSVCPQFHDILRFMIG